MTSFVLVHGAWHGGWCWRNVAPLLRAAGHDVYTPTLTGLGERAHLLSPAIDLGTHIQDVVNVLAYEDLRAAVVVGHSYGGMVITGVAERAGDRVAQLVYLDAHVPAGGQALRDLLGPELWATIQEAAQTLGDGWRLPPPPDDHPFGVQDERDARWVRSRLTEHPLRTLAQPLPPAAGPATLPRTYIHCAENDGLQAEAKRLRAAPGWSYRELATGHDAMVTMPRELAGLLHEAAADADSDPTLTAQDGGS